MHASDAQPKPEPELISINRQKMLEASKAVGVLLIRAAPAQQQHPDDELPRFRSTHSTFEKKVFYVCGHDSLYYNLSLSEI